MEQEMRGGGNHALEDMHAAVEMGNSQVPQ